MKRLVLSCAIALVSAQAEADVGAFVALTYAFGSTNGIGFSLMATNTRHEDRGIVAAGVAYYPFAAGQKFGIPVAAGYQWRNAGVLGGYDLLQGSVFVGGGYANTRHETDSPPADPTAQPTPTNPATPTTPAAPVVNTPVIPTTATTAATAATAATPATPVVTPPPAPAVTPPVVTPPVVTPGVGTIILD